MLLRSLAGIALAASLVASASLAGDKLFPDVMAVKVRAAGADKFDFDVTMTSPYDTAQRYADAFRVATSDGRVLGERILLHDHKDEQPFTRELYGVAIAAGIKTVTIQGRDQLNGYGGKTVVVELPGR